MSSKQMVAMPRPQRVSAKKVASASRRRHELNWRLFVITLGVLVVILPTTYLWYRHQLQRTSTALLARAEQLQKEKNWAQATVYYQRYSLLEPDDTQALVKLVEVTAKREPTPEGLYQLNNLLYRTIGRVPERHDLRRMLAENLLKLGAVEEAEKEAQWLLKNAPEEARAARKIIALSLFARSKSDGGGTLSQVAGALHAAATESPSDVALVEAAATTLREHPTAVEIADTTSASAADQMLDRLVSMDPQKVDARLARFRYRTKYKLPDADSDLKAALELEPENLDAIVASAWSKVVNAPTAEALAEAEKLLGRAILAAPEDPRAYLLLASVLEQSSKPDKALELLERGVDATGHDFNVELACASAQISAKKLDAAKQTMQSLESRSSAYFARLDGNTRTDVQNRMQLMLARLELAQEQPSLAVPRLKALLVTVEATPDYQQSPVWLDASRYLGQVYESLEQWDKASEYWGNVARALPGDEFVVRHAVNAYLKTADPGTAIATIDEYVRVAKPRDELLVQLARAHLMLQLSRPEIERNWLEFEAALKAAKSVAPGRKELVFCELAYLQAKPDRDAVTVLLRACEKTPLSGDSEFWQVAARTYQGIGQPEDMRRAADRHRALASNAIDPAVLEATLLAHEGKRKQADEVLSNLGQSLKPEERKRIERLRIEVLLADNDISGAFQRAQKLVDADPKDSASLATGIDIAISAGQLKTAETWESTLGEVTDKGPEFTSLRARRLLVSFERLTPQEKEELQQAITQLRTARPKWFPAVALAAQLAQAEGDTRKALGDYELAVQLGDRRPATLLQIVTLLNQYGTVEDAQKYLSYLTTNDSDPNFNTLAVRFAEKQGQSAALEMARHGVDQYPSDPMRRVTLANLLLRYGRIPEGLELLRETAKKHREDSRVWLGLIYAYVQTGQADEARKILSALVDSSFLLPEQRYLVGAQGHELLGELEEARRLYKLAVDEKPNDNSVRLKYAKLLKNIDPRAARTEYERVIELDPPNGNARRELAVLLAATKQEADWQRASQLLTSSSGEEASRDAITSDQLRATLLSKKGRTRAERISNCQTARKILQQRIDTDTSNASDLTRLLLAGILEQEAELSKDRSLLIAARDQLRTLVDRKPPSAESLSVYIEFLLRHGASKVTDTENSLSKDSVANIAERKEFLKEAEAKLAEFEQLQKSGDDAHEIASVAFQVRLLRAQNLNAEAQACVTKYVNRRTEKPENQSDQAQQYLAIGNLFSLAGAHAEAEKWYRRLTELNSNAYVLVVQSLLAQEKREEAIRYCLSISKDKLTPQMAALLATVMTTTEPVAEVPEAQAAIEAMVHNNQSNKALLQAEAVRLASRGENKGAVALFRKILTIDPDDALALNNLATLLAETPNERGEALDQIKRAIEIAGRQPMLLDTQGTILLKTGDAENAIACLEEATAGGAADARYYLHLAAAYRLAQRNDDARHTLAEARALGLEKFVLTGDDRKMLDALEAQSVSSVPITGTP